MAKAYIGIPQFHPVFANNTWAEIVCACQKNEVPETWAVGDQKPMLINGQEYLIDIIGKNHDTFSDGSGVAPLTFHLHDCYGRVGMNNSYANNWATCTTRTVELPNILSLMPVEVQNGIKEVDKLTTIGNRSTEVETTAEKLFILSEIEIFGTRTFSKAGEGTKYEYFTGADKRIKTLNGAAGAWWNRSPYGDTYSYCAVTASGGATANGVGSGNNLSFAFCFGGNSELNTVPNGVARNIVGGYIGVNGVARKIKKAYIGVNGVARLVANWGVPALPEKGRALNDYTWEEISLISSAGVADEYFAVGDRKAVTLNGAVGDGLTFNNETYYAHIIGINHNAELEGANRIHFQFGHSDLSGGKEIAFVDSGYGYNQRSGSWLTMNQTQTSAGGWESCHMRNTICTAFENAMPADLQAVLNPVTKYSNNIGASNNVEDITATLDKVFLLSEFEVFGSINYANDAEPNYQKQYAYFLDGHAIKIYKHNDPATLCNVQLRSVYPDFSGCFTLIRMKNSGGDQWYSGSIESLGVAPAFCV